MKNKNKNIQQIQSANKIIYRVQITNFFEKDGKRIDEYFDTLEDAIIFRDKIFEIKKKKIDSPTQRAEKIFEQHDPNFFETKNINDRYRYEQFAKTLETSKSWKELFSKLNLRQSGANRETIIKYIDRYNLDFSHLNTKDSKSSVRYRTEQIFCKDSEYESSSLRKIILRKYNGKIPYKCLCGNEGFWLGKELTLQLEHINGIHNDNRFSNLCFLCPNCHSQTPTHSRKKRDVESLDKYISETQARIQEMVFEKIDSDFIKNATQEKAFNKQAALTEDKDLEFLNNATQMKSQIVDINNLLESIKINKNFRTLCKDLNIEYSNYVASRIIRLLQAHKDREEVVCFLNQYQ